MRKGTLFSLLLLFFINAVAQNTISETLTYTNPVDSVLINNEKIAFQDTGSGATTLLFIHGLSSYMEAWNKNISSLKEDYRCISIDLPGYGKSSKNKLDYTLAEYADFINRFLAEKDLKNVVLVGHSMGGQIAMTTVLKAPENFQKLILIAPAGIETFSEEEGKIMKMSYTAAMVENASEEQIRNNFKLNFYEFPEDAEFMVTDRIAMKNASDFPNYSKMIVNNIHAMLDEPVIDKLSEIKIPVLMIYGANDALIPNKYFHPTQDLEFLATKAKTKMPQLQVKIIDKAGHFVNFEKAKMVNNEIESFLKH